MVNNAAVRFGAVFAPIDVVNPTVRFSYILCPTLRFGAVFRYYWKTYWVGAVRCSAVRFSRWQKSYLVQCGVVRFKRISPSFNRTSPHRTDRKDRNVKNPDYYNVVGNIIILDY